MVNEIDTLFKNLLKTMLLDVYMIGKPSR